MLWQDFLESTFPSKTLQPKVRHVSRTARPSDKPAEIKAVREQWVETVQMEQRLDKRNTACKFVLDQTLGAFVNTVIFLAAMAALEGKGRHEILAAVAEVSCLHYLVDRVEEKADERVCSALGRSCSRATRCGRLCRCSSLRSCRRTCA